ncbi:MAG: phosphate ABC transporter permease PstA [Planctomycetes bacterium]|nr:phosphate ABC transporter permease PstA [Planctomycetota bacterium]
MGLTIGLVMVASLLLVIISQGVGVFWPKRVTRFVLPDESGKRIEVDGVVVKRQLKTAEAGKAPIEEIQIYTGNREVYSLAFRYLDVHRITSESLPADALLIERLENGNAIGTPISLKTGSSTGLPAEDPSFRSGLAKAIEEASARRSAIDHLEKHVIGRNAAEISELEVRAKSAAPDRQQALEADIATLKTRYQELAAEAKRLRKVQNEQSLEYRLASGETRTVAIGSIIDHHYPNQLGFLSRFGRFCENLWNFVSERPREANTEGGIFPAIFGTFVMTLLMSLLVAPFGVLAAIYLREYAKQGPIVRMVRIAVNNLAGVPSIVFGVFGLGFFVYFVGGSIDRAFFSQCLPNPTVGTGGIGWAAMTLALMTLPVVIVATEEAVVAVPRGAREGSLACGASKWQTIQRIVLPAAVPGILTGMILAMARGAGEVAPLMLVGVVKLAPSLPLDLEYPFFHLNQKFMHLGFHIYDLGFQSPDSEAARPMVFATTLFLILLVIVLNLGAILLRERLRRRFATAAF